MADRRLIVQCKNCGRDFDTPLKMSVAALDQAPIREREYRCPHCGETHTYKHSDHSFKD